ncbi:MAG: hypothetical protein H0T17_03405, partial [Propionibacteriales bacterium]|nr:hypothetical protein [Propionibacteriales bacterium]
IDEVMLEEIDLLTEILIAATCSLGVLTQDRIDELLGVIRDETMPQLGSRAG